jgi:hypothetical protein
MTDPKLTPDPNIEDDGPDDDAEAADAAYEVIEPKNDPVPQPEAG